MSAFSPPTKLALQDVQSLRAVALPTPVLTQRLQVFGAAIFLVVVPVFFQAPLVRSLPWLSLALTGTWLLAGVSLASRTSSRLWGDLLIGFTWTWLAGSLYWGWLRAEPLWHLPIEALGLPIAVGLLAQGRGRVGSYFFLGSLLGTAVTDLYIHWADLLPLWRQVMQVDPEWVPAVLQEAAIALQNSTDVSRGLLIALGLLVVGIVPLRSQQTCWWAFSGAVLSTLVVDLLFLTSALCL
ncbi:MAG TPA: DUF3120 domain-containing protein [Candidatus Obscuribacterales bacterium]